MNLLLTCAIYRSSELLAAEQCSMTFWTSKDVSLLFARRQTDRALYRGFQLQFHQELHLQICQWIWSPLTVKSELVVGFTAWHDVRFTAAESVVFDVNNFDIVDVIQDCCDCTSIANVCNATTIVGLSSHVSQGFKTNNFVVFKNYLSCCLEILRSGTEDWYLTFQPSGPNLLLLMIIT